MKINVNKTLLLMVRLQATEGCCAWMDYLSNAATVIQIEVHHLQVSSKIKEYATVKLRHMFKFVFCMKTNYDVPFTGKLHVSDVAFTASLLYGWELSW